jgi:hypothetical protein
MMLKEREKIPYLERWSPVHGGEYPSSQVPCLKSTAFMPLALLSPCICFPSKDIYLYRDNITMPDASVGHTGSYRSWLQTYNPFNRIELFLCAWER